MPQHPAEPRPAHHPSALLSLALAVGQQMPPVAGLLQKQTVNAGGADDDAGNARTLLDASDDGIRCTHDAWNRLVKVQTVASGGSVVATVAE